MRKVLCTITLAALPLGQICAGEFSGEPFLLRLALSIDRASNYTDTAARLASVAYPGGSSYNPAGHSFRSSPGTREGTPLAFTTINALSDSGAWISAAAVTSTLHEGENGVLSAEYHYTKTLDSENQEGFDSRLKAQEFVLGWSRQLGDDLSVGVRGRIVPADIRHEALAPEFGFEPLQADTDQFGTDLWAGVMGRVTNRVLAGAALRLGWVETETIVRNLEPLGLIPALTELDRVDDDAQIRGLKLGLGYQADNDLQLYADLQYLGIHSNVAGSLEVARASSGIQFKVSPAVSGILGLTYDSQSELTVGVGLQARPAEDVLVHVAYQYNGAPEIDREFGRVDYLNASLAIRF